MIWTEMKYRILSERKYRISFLVSVIIFPLFNLINYFFSGEFVRKVFYFERSLSYFIFLIVSSAIVLSFKDFIRGLGDRVLLKREEWLDFLMFGKVFYMLKKNLVKTFIEVFENILEFLPAFIIFPRSLLFLLSFPLAILSSFPIYLIFLSIALFWKRRDAGEVFYQIMIPFISLLLPTTYSILVIFRGSERFFYLIPFASLYEIIRKFIFLGVFDTDGFLISIFSCSFWWTFSLILFQKALEHSRKTGKIRLY